ncbi:Minichromosome maintenance domain-containing protein 2 [Dissophora ornata]|nr:Minichromosome maintenance domain-containing protein 2 [Dissophora ornata]
MQAFDHHQSLDDRSSAVSVAERDVECGTRTTRKAQIRPSIHVLVLKNNHDTLVPALISSVASCRNAFDIVVLQDEMDGVSEVSQAIATHTIRRHMMDSAEYPSQRRVTLADLSQFIRLASKIDVRLSLECEQLLRSYFEVMRSKGSGLEMKELSSISVMSTLLRLATCHAKLCFRPIATTDDALVSIMMVEETVAARFGVSRLGFVPLMDGKENITRLYSQPAFPEFIVDHDFSRVPMTDTNEYGLDLDVDTNVPISVQEGRDLMMERM